MENQRFSIRNLCSGTKFPSKLKSRLRRQNGGFIYETVEKSNKLFAYSVHGNGYVCRLL